MKDFLFNTPFWFLAGAAIIGIGLFIYGNRRTDAALSNIGAAIFCVGVLFFLMSWFVDTDKEKCVRRTRSLVNAVEKRDWKRFDELVAPACTVRVPVGGAIYQTRDELHRATEKAVDMYQLSSNSVLSIDVADTGDFIKVYVTVLSQGIAYPLTTSWEMQWQDTGAGWQLTDLNALKINNETGAQMEHNIPKVN